VKQTRKKGNRGICVRAQTGTISASGVYTAPEDLPIPANLNVTATSHADLSKSGPAVVTVQSDVGITLPSGGGAGAVPIELGATHAFLAVVSSGAHPDKSVVWRVSGASCPLLCGSGDASGNYNAPQILPASPNVTLTARSVADATKQVSTDIAITSNFLLQLSVPATVAASSTATFIATLKPVPGCNRSTALSWSLSGRGCNGENIRECGNTVLPASLSVAWNEQGVFIPGRKCPQRGTPAGNGGLLVETIWVGAAEKQIAGIHHMLFRHAHN